MKYKILDKSGDIGIRVSGRRLNDALKNLAGATYDLITDIKKIKPVSQFRIKLSTDSMENLIVSFLNELIYNFEVRGFLGKKFEINLFKKLKTFSLKSVIYGEKFNALKHTKKFLLKAATYHDIKIENKNGKWTIQVIFDI